MSGPASCTKLQQEKSWGLGTLLVSPLSRVAAERPRRPRPLCSRLARPMGCPRLASSQHGGIGVRDGGAAANELPACAAGRSREAEVPRAAASVPAAAPAGYITVAGGWGFPGSPTLGFSAPSGCAEHRDALRWPLAPAQGETTAQGLGGAGTGWWVGRDGHRRSPAGRG